MRQLAAAREAGDAEELTQLLRTMMMRNHLQVDRPELHTECRVGTKHAIEAYDAEQAPPPLTPPPAPTPAPAPRSAVAWRMAEGNYRDDITALVVYLPCLG